MTMDNYTADENFNVAQYYALVPDWAKAVRFWLRAAAKGSAAACYELGKCRQSRVELLKMAAKEGHAPAQYELAMIHEDGIDGGMVSKRKAIYWLTKAAEQGHMDSSFVLGMKYIRGEGVHKNEGLAMHYLIKAGANGHTLAQTIVSDCYTQGLGVEQDHRMAGVWMLMAAERGSASAQYSLANMYEEGRGVDRDEKAAAYWTGKAVRQASVAS